MLQPVPGFWLFPKAGVGGVPGWLGLACGLAGCGLLWRLACLWPCQSHQRK
jgi:hypothetical protein